MKWLLKCNSTCSSLGRFRSETSSASRIRLAHNILLELERGNSIELMAEFFIWFDFFSSLFQFAVFVWRACVSVQLKWNGVHPVQFKKEVWSGRAPPTCHPVAAIHPSAARTPRRSYFPFTRRANFTGLFNIQIALFFFFFFFFFFLFILFFFISPLSFQRKDIFLNENWIIWFLQSTPVHKTMNDRKSATSTTSSGFHRNMGWYN